jgi:hypothetical protein
MLDLGGKQEHNLVAMRLTKAFFAKQGSKGGKLAAQRMTRAERIARAQKAAAARHAKKGGQQ